MRHALVLGMLVATASGANARTVGSSNSPFAINTSVGETVDVVDGGALTVAAGGSVTPPARDDEEGAVGVSASGTSSVTIDGGEVSGGEVTATGFPSFAASGPSGVSATDQADITVNSGSVSGGATSANGQFGGTGLTVNGTGDVTISGGAITGGAVTGNFSNPGDAVDIDTTGTVTITGGMFRSGAQIGNCNGNGDVGDIRNAEVQISGGTFEGEFGGDGLELGDVRNSSITGGTFIGGDGFVDGSSGAPSSEGSGLRVSGASVLSIFDGTFTGGETVRSSGTSHALRVFNTSEVTVFGGSFADDEDALLELNGDSVLHLRGGVIEGSAELRLRSTLNIFGLSDLMFNGTTVAGTLLSGDAINLDVAFEDPRAQINLNVIPLPAGAWLLLSGIAAMGAARRFRRG